MLFLAHARKGSGLVAIKSAKVKRLAWLLIRRGQVC